MPDILGTLNTPLTIKIDTDMNKQARQELLKSFCNTNEGSTMSCPFLCGDFVCATDGHAILLLPATDEDRAVYPVAEKKYSDVIMCYAVTQKEFLTLFTIEHLKAVYEDILKRLGQIPDTCPECNGNGMVAFSYTTKDNHEYTISSECPVCMGTGKGDVSAYTKQKEYNLQLNDKYMFHVNRVSDIIRTLGFFKKKQCTLMKQLGSKEYPYHIVEPEFHLMLMPSIYL